MTPAKRPPAARRARQRAARVGPRRLRLLLDANVVLDVLANRVPWAHEAALLLSAVEAGRAVAAHTVMPVA